MYAITCVRACASVCLSVCVQVRASACVSIYGVWMVLCFCVYEHIHMVSAWFYACICMSMWYVTDWHCTVNARVCVLARVPIRTDVSLCGVCMSLLLIVSVLQWHRSWAEQQLLTIPSRLVCIDHGVMVLLNLSTTSLLNSWLMQLMHCDDAVDLDNHWTLCIIRVFAVKPFISRTSFICCNSIWFVQFRLPPRSFLIAIVAIVVMLGHCAREWVIATNLLCQHIFHNAHYHTFKHAIVRYVCGWLFISCRSVFHVGLSFCL